MPSKTPNQLTGSQLPDLAPSTRSGSGAQERDVVQAREQRRIKRLRRLGLAAVLVLAYPTYRLIIGDPLGWPQLPVWTRCT